MGFPHPRQARGDKSLLGKPSSWGMLAPLPNQPREDSANCSHWGFIHTSSSLGTFATWFPIQTTTLIPCQVLLPPPCPTSPSTS